MQLVKPAPLYVGAMNDCLFVIDGPPRPSGTDTPPHDDYGPNVVATVNSPAFDHYASTFAAAPELRQVCERLDDLARRRALDAKAIHSITLECAAVLRAIRRGEEMSQRGLDVS